MKKITQKSIAEKVPCCTPHLSQLINTDKTGKRPRVKLARRLGDVTGIPPEVWLLGSTAEIKKALKDLTHLP